MNLWQFCRQFKKVGTEAEWTDGSAERVFGSVIVTPIPTEQSFDNLSFPVLLLTPLTGNSDPLHGEEPSLIEYDFEATIIQAVAGDDIGEPTLLGANRTELGSSRGRGLLELEEELFRAANLLNNIDGIRVVSTKQSATGANLVADLGYVAWKDYTFKVLLRDFRFYHSARNLAANVNTDATVSLEWNLPPTDRYDLHQMVLRRATGSTPPAEPTDGTGVTLGSDLATSVVDGPLASDTYSYSLFAGYDEKNETPSENERFSEKITKTVVVP